jgi:hypothetical protein
MSIVDPYHERARVETLDDIDRGGPDDRFNELTPPEYELTGGRTLAEAWHAGDHDAVKVYGSSDDSTAAQP